MLNGTILASRLYTIINTDCTKFKKKFYEPAVVSSCTNIIASLKTELETRQTHAELRVYEPTLFLREKKSDLRNKYIFSAK